MASVWGGVFFFSFPVNGGAAAVVFLAGSTLKLVTTLLYYYYYYSILGTHLIRLADTAAQ